MNRTFRLSNRRAPASAKLSVCSMLAAALGSMSTPAIVASTGVLGFMANDSIAQSTTSESREKAATLRLMSKPVTLDVQDQPLEDIINYIIDVTGAQLEPIYLDSLASTGMDPTTLLTLRVNNVAAISVLERVLKKTERIESLGQQYTWQFTDIGSIECGPKSALNENSRIELYDIADLIMAIPDFDNAPNFNISSSSSGGGGGGGGGGRSPFSGSTGKVDIESSAVRSARIISLIESSVEPEQWASAGGTGASLSVYGTSLVINAPDYIHRQIVGYDFWPARLHTIRNTPNGHSVHVRPDPAMRKP